MSEIAATTTVSESTPTSTADVAANVIDSYDGAQSTDDDGIAVSGEPPAVESFATPASETPAIIEPPPNTPEPAKELSDEEKLLEEFGFKQAFKPDGREHYIPRSKVLKMIGSGLARGREAWGKEKTTFESQVQELSGHLEQLRAGVAGDEVAFLSELAQIDPRYKRFLEQPQAQVAQTPPPSAAMPDPDLQLADGSRTYSLDGLKALLEWNTAQVESRLMPKVDERLKPLTEREAQIQQQREREQFQQSIQARTKSQMEEAQTWPMFGKLAADGSVTEFQREVLEELRKDSETAKAAKRRPTMTMRQAYLEVESRYKSAEYNTVRERILKELNQAPRSTSMPRQATDSPRTPGPATTQDIASRTLDRLERGA